MTTAPIVERDGKLVAHAHPTHDPYGMQRFNVDEFDWYRAEDDQP